EDQFQALEPKSYVRTLVNKDHSRAFVVAVNRDCTRARPLRIVPVKPRDGSLRDLENGAIAAFGTSGVYPAGDGRIFEVMRPGAATSATASPNLTGSSSAAGDPCGGSLLRR